MPIGEWHVSRDGLIGDLGKRAAAGDVTLTSDDVRAIIQLLKEPAKDVVIVPWQPPKKRIRKRKPADVSTANDDPGGWTDEKCEEFYDLLTQPPPGNAKSDNTEGEVNA